MVQTLKYTLIFTFIIIISSITFAISEGTSVPIYLTVPEYLKITELPDVPRLDLYAEFFWDWFETVKDSLTFNVESNVNYNLSANFEVDLEDNESLLSNLLGFIEDPENSIKNNYSLLITDEDGQEFVGYDGHDISVSSISPGIHNYSLTFRLDVEGLVGIIFYPLTEAKIGDIEITVSSSE